MRTEQPPGIRTTKSAATGAAGSGGDWKHARDAEQTWFVTEYLAMLAPMAESERALFKQELKAKLTQGGQGRLSYGSASHHDVCCMGRHPDVLEIRMQDYTGFPEDDPDGDPEPRHTRLYFTEPAPAPLLLLTLAIKSKCPGPLGLDEQDRHVAEAQARLDRFGLWLLHQGITVGSY